jgi:hypothetical protein
MGNKFNKIDLDFFTSLYHIYNDTLVIFGLAQFHHDALQLTITRLNEVILASSWNEMQCSLLLQVNLPNKQLVDVYVLP